VSGPPHGTATVTRGRLVGVDAARGVALLGMVAVHVFPSEDADGSESLTYALASGRSAALFAVLAGVGVALATGRERPPTGSRRVRASAAITARAVLLALVGLLLGELDSGLAVILAYYGVLFLFALPLLGARPGRLATAAVASAFVVPVASFVVRDLVAAPDRTNPTLTDLAAPGDLLLVLLLTGYYPVLVWTAYLFTGMAVGRLPLQRPRVAAALALGGAGLAALAATVSRLLLGPLGGYDALDEVIDAPRGETIEQVVGESRFGNVPLDSPWWLATTAPHSSTPLDLLHTVGTALLVLGLALLVASRVRWLLLPLAALGAMPLTLYTVHVVVVASVDAADPLRFYLVQLAVGTAFALLWRRRIGRGPLEALLALAARAAGAASPQHART
jgi:uncharacterized membrane protein